MAKGEIKKHVGAVHVKGRLSLLQRKVSNVLLLNAYNELAEPDVHEHMIRLKTLAEVAGYDSNDHEVLREALEALVDIKIKWNILDQDGEEEWGVSSFLAQAITKSGKCRYAYPPDLRRKLFNPEIYARINLAVQERFGSGYALALYENCVRFRKVGTTGWIDLEQWRDLLGIEDGQYEQFKYLNRDVLKPAIEEIIRYSDIRVTMERKREKRRVTALKFKVEENPQLSLDLGGRTQQAAVEAFGEKALPDPRAMAPGPERLLGPLQRRLMGFGLSEAQALDVSTEFEKGRIEGNLGYVEAELERGRAIANVPAFTLDAIRVDYRPRVTEVEQQVRRRQKAKEEAQAGARRGKEQAEAEAYTRKLEAEEAARTEEARRAARLDETWDVLGEAERAEIQEQVVRSLKEDLPFVYRMYEQERRAGTLEQDMPVAVRSTLKGYRYKILEARA